MSNILNGLLSKDEVRLITKAINDSKKQCEHHIEERNLGYGNGKYLDRWNYAFHNLEKAFNKVPFLTIHVDRGPLWEFLLIYNTTNKFIYLIMKRDTFNQVKNQKEKRIHYARLLNSKNFEIQEEKVQKINFFTGFEDITPKYIDESLEKIVGEIKDEVKGCVNVLFRENADGVYKISANLANYDLDIFETYDLTKYITADISEIVDTKPQPIITQPKIDLPIRENKIKKHGIVTAHSKVQKDEEKNNE